MKYKPAIHRRPEDGFETKYFKSIGGFREKRPWISIKQVSFKRILLGMLLEHTCLKVWIRLREQAVKAGDFTFYEAAIRIAANYAYVIVSKEGLIEYCSEEILHRQLTILWNYVSELGKQACPVDEVWEKTILRLKRDKTNKYSLVTEPDVSTMLSDYSLRLLNESDFDEPYRQFPVFSFPTKREISNPQDIRSRLNYMDNFTILENSIAEDIKNQLNDMDVFHSLEEDDYTRLLVMIARGKFAELTDTLLPHMIKESVDPETIPRVDNSGVTRDPLQDFDRVIVSVTTRFQDRIWNQLSDLVEPWCHLLFHHEVSSCYAVCEVFEVAELRRRALGRRFIGRELFVWAFYNCGYALPVVVHDRAKLKTLDEDDHPFSQICRAAIKLVVSLGEECVDLQHVIFVALYADEYATVENFRIFMEMVDADTKHHPALKRQRQDDFHEIFEGGFPIFKLKKRQP